MRRESEVWFLERTLPVPPHFRPHRVIGTATSSPLTTTSHAPMYVSCAWHTARYTGHVGNTINGLIRHVVARGGGSLTDVVPIVGNGSVNRVFVATTERGKLVARLNADRGLDEFRKEAWCIEQAAARGVLGPAVLDMGQKDGYSYMVQSFLEGAVGSEGAI